VYDEPYERIKSHPLLAPTAETANQIKLIERDIDPKTAYLEIGASGCGVSSKYLDEVPSRLSPPRVHRRRSGKVDAG
jgi:hypothetical protein